PPSPPGFSAPTCWSRASTSAPARCCWSCSPPKFTRITHSPHGRFTAAGSPCQPGNDTRRGRSVEMVDERGTTSDLVQAYTNLTRITTSPHGRFQAACSPCEPGNDTRRGRSEEMVDERGTTSDLVRAYLNVTGRRKLLTDA